MNTCPTNHWSPEEFQSIVWHQEQQAVRVVAAYGDVALPAIRAQVLNAIVTYAMPAGNA